MNRILRSIICIAVAAVCLIYMAACGGDSTTTTVASTTAGGAVTTTGGQNQTTTGATTTTNPTTTVVAPVSNPQTGPYAFYQQVEVIDFCGYTMVGNNGYGSLREDGSVIAESNLTMFTTWDTTMKHGKITARFTGAPDNDKNTNGICFNIQGKGMKGILEEDPSATPYFFEKDYYYYICFIGMKGTMGLCKASWKTNQWTNLQWSGNIEGYEQGSEYTITVEVPDDGVIKCYYNDQLLIEFTDPDPITDGEGVGIRLKETGAVCNSIKIEPKD